MRTGSKALRVIEHAFLVLGLLLLFLFSFAYIHRLLMLRGEIARFDARMNESFKHPREVKEVGSNASHTARLYQPANKTDEVLAVLRIPKLRLEVPVLDGTDAFTLNRGVGRIAGTSRPGQGGNVGIAGHRDSFFRPLRDINAGDSIELVTTSGTDIYAVDRVRITTPADISALSPKTEPSLTLVTCYPFYFVGPAPQRYVVEASLRP